MKQILPKILSLHIDNLAVENTNKIKYLGVIIKDRLTWTEHILQITKQSKRGLEMLSSISKKTWGAIFCDSFSFLQALGKQRLNSKTPLMLATIREKI